MILFFARTIRQYLFLSEIDLLKKMVFHFEHTVHTYAYILHVYLLVCCMSETLVFQKFSPSKRDTVDVNKVSKCLEKKPKYSWKCWNETKKKEELTLDIFEQIGLHAFLVDLGRFIECLEIHSSLLFLWWCFVYECEFETKRQTTYLV